MRKNKFIFYGALTVMGLGMLVLGLIFVKSDLTIPYLSVGVGAGLFGHGLGAVINLHQEKKHPDFAKQQEILRKDERNVAIANRAKAKGYDSMVYVFGALLVAFGIMNVSLKVILLLVGAYLFVCGTSIYYRIKYDREM